MFILNVGVVCCMNLVRVFYKVNYIFNNVVAFIGFVFFVCVLFTLSKNIFNKESCGIH
jgi:hypothetical protein